MKHKLVVLLVLFGLILSGCGDAGCPADELDSYVNEVNSITRAWDSLISQTPDKTMDDIGPVIDGMVELRDEANALAVPECAQDTNSLLVSYMDDVIDALETFEADGDPDAVAAAVDAAQPQLDDFFAGIADLGYEIESR